MYETRCSISCVTANTATAYQSNGIPWREVCRLRFIGQASTSMVVVKMAEKWHKQRTSSSFKDCFIHRRSSLSRLDRPVVHFIVVG
jgi:hypothetical protein